VSILDIGCGIGGIHPAISREYHGKAFFTMYDKTKTERTIWYKFAKTGAFYNNLALTRQFLIDNDVPAAQIETLEASEKPVFSRKYDLITSFISWGWHYPLSTYWDVVVDALKDDGILIVDIRHGQGARETIEKTFVNVKSIDRNRRGERIVAWGKR
jgi:SAM-dependent methyltransferase